MSEQQKQGLDRCGCCDAATPATPRLVWNRPGLSAVDYRVGTYASFRQAMLEAIAGSPELALWSSRDSGDFGIALLEMWAYLADVLTFYQERAANEAFLRTALHRESVLRLAALVGYRLAPGAAATAHLAFTTEADKTVRIPKRLRVQSVPAQDEKPQKYETVETVKARPGLNRLGVVPEPEAYNPLARGSTTAQLRSAAGSLAPGDSLLLFDAVRAEPKELTGLVSAESPARLRWQPAVHGAGFGAFTSRLAPYKREIRLFGHNAPSSYFEPVPAPGSPGLVQWKQRKAGTDFHFSLPQPGHLALDAGYDDLTAGTSVVLVQAGASASAPRGFARLARVTRAETKQASFGQLEDTVTHLRLGLGMVGDPVVVRDTVGRLRVFTIADDGAVWTVGQKAPNDGWGSWQSLGGRVDRLAAGLNADGRLEVFARGPDKALWHIREAIAGASWGAWASLGGRVDLLEVGANADGRLEVFARGQDGALWHIWQRPQNQGWSGWSSLRGQIDRLALGSNADGRLEVFARGLDRALWHIWQVAPNDGWSRWASLGGQLDRLAVGANADGRLELFVRGADWALWHKWQMAPNGGWGPWASQGGLLHRMAVGSNQDGRLEVFVQGLDGALWNKWQVAPNDGWSPAWNRLGGLIDRLAVGANADGRLEAFARGMDRALWHRWQVAPSDGWNGWKSRGVPIWPIDDRRKIRIFELSGEELRLWSHRYPDRIPAGSSSVYVPLAKLAALESGRALILGDGKASPEAVTSGTASSIDVDGDGKKDHLRIGFTPALTSNLATASAILRGNVARATHGETVSSEVLGSGDASEDYQSFALKKSPVTHVSRAGATGGVASTLELRVDEVRWKKVPTFYGRAADARVYTARIDDAGRTTVRFGDGRHGARLTTGRNNISADYRQGHGLSGRVGAGTLTTLLDRPLGLKEVTNPGPAQGGADPETLAKARRNAPNSVRTFGRIVSLRDFEDAARGYIGVAKARAEWRWDGEERIVRLTVAGDGDSRLGDTAMAALVADLDSRRDRNRRLEVRNFTRVPVFVWVRIATHPDHRSEVVRKAARAALEAHFAFDNLDLGQPIQLSDLYRVLHGVPGLVAADMELMNLKPWLFNLFLIALQFFPAALTQWQPFLDDLRRRGMRFKGPWPELVQPRLLLYPGELARLDQPATDLTVNLGMATS